MTRGFTWNVQWGFPGGNVEPRYAAYRIGPLNQSRWLTLAIRLMSIWTRGAFLQELYPKLRILVQFIVKVYAVCWFEIKRDNKFHHQQLYIFNMINKMKELPVQIQEVAFSNLQYNAFGLLPENILYAMLKSDELTVREEAINKILSIR